MIEVFLAGGLFNGDMMKQYYDKERFKKTVFVSHPISGDMENNIKKVLDICRKIHSKNIIPVAPYLVAVYWQETQGKVEKIILSKTSYFWVRKYVYSTP